MAQRRPLCRAKPASPAKPSRPSLLTAANHSSPSPKLPFNPSSKGGPALDWGTGVRERTKIRPLPLIILHFLLLLIRPRLPSPSPSPQTLESTICRGKEDPWSIDSLLRGNRALEEELGSCWRATPNSVSSVCNSPKEKIFPSELPHSTTSPSPLHARQLI